MMRTHRQLPLQFPNRRLQLSHPPKHISQPVMQPGTIRFKLRRLPVLCQRFGKLALSLMAVPGQLTQPGRPRSRFPQRLQTRLGQPPQQLPRLKPHLRARLARQRFPKFLERFHASRLLQILPRPQQSRLRLQRRRLPRRLSLCTHAKQARQRQPIHRLQPHVDAGIAQHIIARPFPLAPRQDKTCYL